MSELYSLSRHAQSLFLNVCLRLYKIFALRLQMINRELQIYQLVLIKSMDKFFPLD